MQRPSIRMRTGSPIMAVCRDERWTISGEGESHAQTGVSANFLTLGNRSSCSKSARTCVVVGPWHPPAGDFSYRSHSVTRDRSRALNSPLNAPGRYRHFQFPMTVPGRFMRAMLPRPSTSCSAPANENGRQSYDFARWISVAVEKSPSLTMSAVSSTFRAH